MDVKIKAGRKIKMKRDEGEKKQIEKRRKKRRREDEYS
jgi:hypothetical protein